MVFHTVLDFVWQFFQKICRGMFLDRMFPDRYVFLYNIVGPFAGLCKDTQGPHKMERA